MNTEMVPVTISGVVKTTGSDSGAAGKVPYYVAYLFGRAGRPRLSLVVLRFVTGLRVGEQLQGGKLPVGGGETTVRMTEDRSHGHRAGRPLGQASPPASGYT